MRKAILRSQLLTVLVGLAAALLVAVFLFDRALIEEQSATLQQMVQSAAELWDDSAPAQEQLEILVGEQEDLRATLIAADGTVLADTEADPATMENHLDRPEIQAVADGESATSFRVSETLGSTMLYAAAKTPGGSYLRLARSGEGLLSEIKRLFPSVLIGAAIAMGISLLLARRLTRGILTPIQALNRQMGRLRSGELPEEPVTCPFPELQETTDQIAQLTREMGVYIRQLEEQQHKTDYILNHIEEGFVVLDERQRIVMMNQSAQRQLRCGPNSAGQPLGRVIPNPKVIQQARETQDDRKRRKIDLTCQGRIYAVRIRRTTADAGMGEQVILTLNDVTEERSSSRMRQEFFSNASHELKTPITAIKGSTELLCSGLPLTEEQRQELLGRIGLETERMSSVIEDIIMLSRLESGALREETERLDFGKVVSDCAREWEAAAAAGGVTISCQVRPVWIYASRKNLRELADNLISNAVKYNRPGGRVEIALTGERESCRLVVRNDGEPIPPDQQRRVFERFYRVDKGRSRSAGGTGLGLSIVKHVVESMDGRIRLESNRSLGTRFTVTLPVRAYPEG